jgi:hypothetical protein
MDGKIYLEVEFWAFLLCTLVLPIGIFAWMITKRRFSRKTIVGIGNLLVLLSGLDAIFLQRLSTKAKASVSLLDDRILASELSIALYIIPLILAGIGINLVSDVLCAHLTIAELDEPEEAETAPTPTA